MKDVNWTPAHVLNAALWLNAMAMLWLMLFHVLTLWPTALPFSIIILMAVGQSTTLD